MNLKKLVASLVLLTQATNAFAIGQAGTQVLADKIKSVTGSGTINVNTANTWTIPNATDTAVGKATTDVLTNKSLSTGGTNTVGATTISGVTGSGSLVFGTTPTIGTPAITGGTISGASMTGTTTFPGTSSVDGSGNAIFGGTGNIAGATLIGAAGSADSKAVFELQSTSKGFLPPRMTTAQKNAIASPTTGLVVYDTDLKSIQVYNGTSWVTAGSGGLSYAADTGAANAYVIAPTPAALAYNTGDTYIFKAVNANTTSSTLNVSALGVKNIKTPQVGNLPANAILTGAIVMVVYDGTQFQIISQQDPSRVSPLTTKGDTHTFSTVDARVAVPGDYGRMVPDSNATTGWRPASYTQFQNGAPYVNYIQYADFENNATTGWTASGCATITGGLPACNGSAGNPFSSANGGRTKGANTSSPAIDSGSNVAGTYSMNLATTGAGTIGDGYVSSSYSIDPKVRGSSLAFNVSYKVASGTPVAGGTLTDTYAVAAYSPAENTFITVTNPFCFTKASGQGTCQGLIPTNTATTSLQLFVYSPVAPTGASSLLFDDVNIGTWQLATGPPITNAVSFTPTGSWVSNSTYTGWWWRDGDKLSMRVKIALTGAPTAATLTVTLPNSLVIDTTKLPATPTNHVFPSQMSGQGAAHTFVGSIVYASTTAVGVQSYQDGFNAAVMTLGATNATSPYTFANGDFIYFEVHGIPITGWDSNMTVASSTNNSPTVSIATTGSHTGGFSANATGTYTPPPGVKYIIVEMAGAGGGGGSSGTTTTGTNGGNGTNTVFGVYTAGLGSGGAKNSSGTAGGGGAGGTNTTGSGTILDIPGTQGDRYTADTSGVYPGSAGGTNIWSGAHIQDGTGNGVAAVANTGGGGEGGCGKTASTIGAGGGGGAGAYQKMLISNPSAVSFTVGAKGAGQTAGASGCNSGAGADGQIVVWEYYIPNPNVGIDQEAVTSQTATYTASVTDKKIIFTSGSDTLNLPAAAQAKGKTFNVVATTGATSVTITPASGTICGQTSVVLTQNESGDFASDGTNYQGLNGACMVTRTADLHCAAASSIVSQKGNWVSSIGNVSAGVCNVNYLASTIWSAAPSCTSTIIGTTQCIYMNTVTTSLAPIGGFNCSTVAAATTFDEWLTCTGPR